jgi:hypothetical protein
LRYARHTTLALFTVLAGWFSLASGAEAHHVLGRPSYALNENSNTPPSMQVETMMGDYFINYMVFPAFPRLNEPGRIHLYAKRIDNQVALQKNVTFTVRDNSWAAWLGFGSNEEILGTQAPDDRVYRQGFVFSKDGDYIITARFQAGGAPYIIDFPLRIGAVASVGPLGITAVLILGILVTVSLIQRRRAMTGIIRAHRERHEKGRS